MDLKVSEWTGMNLNGSGDDLGRIWGGSGEDLEWIWDASGMDLGWI